MAHVGMRMTYGNEFLVFFFSLLVFVCQEWRRKVWFTVNVHNSYPPNNCYLTSRYTPLVIQLRLCYISTLNTVWMIS
jgi:hypothetical protein